MSFVFSSRRRSLLALSCRAWCLYSAHTTTLKLYSVPPRGLRLLHYYNPMLGAYVNKPPVWDDMARLSASTQSVDTEFNFKQLLPAFLQSFSQSDIAGKWMEVDNSVKSQIKGRLFKILGSSAPEEIFAQKAIAKIAGIEFPENARPEIFELLRMNLADPNNSAALKHASLETLGLVWDQIPSYSDNYSYYKFPKPYSYFNHNLVFDAVVAGMQLAEHSPEFRLAALRVLKKTSVCLECHTESDFYINMVSELAFSEEGEIGEAAFDCLSSIAYTSYLYFDVLQPFVPTLIERTLNVIREGREVVALRAFQFWHLACKRFIEPKPIFIGSDGEEERPGGCCPAYYDPSDLPFIRQDMSPLVSTLLETFFNDKEWFYTSQNNNNLSSAVSTCLRFVARILGDDMIPHVLSFVDDNISKTDWRCRGAATYAFCSLFNGDFKSVNLVPLVRARLGFLIDVLKHDNNNLVKTTAAFTLSRIFKVLHTPAHGFSILSPDNLESILEALLESIKDAPERAEKGCEAISYFAFGYVSDGTGSSPFSPYLPNIISRLMETADRSSDFTVKNAVYRTLNEVVVKCSNITDTAHTVAKLLPLIMDELGRTIALQVLASDDEENRRQLQAHLCNLVKVIIIKLSSSDDTKSIVLEVADQMMSCGTSPVLGEAMLAFGALAMATGQPFAYRINWFKYLERSLQDFGQYPTYRDSNGLIGNICSDLIISLPEHNFDKFMSHLVKTLSSGMHHQSNDPYMLSYFGDIAFAMGQRFEKYFPETIGMIQKSADIFTQQDTSNNMNNYYRNNLRLGILNAYSGIARGFRSCEPDVILRYLEDLPPLLVLTFRDKQRGESVTNAAVMVMGDVADTLGSNMNRLFQDQILYTEFLGECLESDDDKLKTTATLVKWKIRRICAQEE